MSEVGQLPPLLTADGRTITWSWSIDPVQDPGSGVDPDPDPDPGGQQGLPHGQRRILWHHGWHGPRVNSWPADVLARLTTVCLAMCQSDGDGTGRLTAPPGVTGQQVAALVADGVDVQLGIGGAKDGGITVLSGLHVADLVASVKAQRDALGVTGICWDLEGTPGRRWQVGPVVDASLHLLDSGLRVGIWSSLWGGRLQAWGAVAEALGDRLDHWQRGFYDFPEAADQRLSGIVVRDMDRMRAYVARDDQLVASFAPVASSSRTPPHVMTAALAAARQDRSMVGWSVWEDWQDSRAGWTSTRSLADV